MNEVKIYGDIGWDVRAAEIDEKLSSFNEEPVRIRINSGGGDVYEGIAILNSLRSYAGELTIIVESLAASAASFIAVGAGAEVIIRPNAEVMIHKAWTMLAGNADDVDKAKADLARQDVKIAKIYAERAGGELDDWLTRMSAETWYSAEEALDAGLVDRIEDAKSPAAQNAGTRRVFAQFRFANRAAAPPPVTRSESGDKTTTPSDGQKGDTVSVLNKLAQELGKKPEDVQAALSGFFNETVQVTGELEVTYPANTAVAPTERVSVEPVIGDAKSEESEHESGNATPQNSIDDLAIGLTFAVGDAPEGWDVAVDESTGVLTVKAPSGAEPGENAEVTVRVNDSTDVVAGFTVRSLSDDDDEGEAGEESDVGEDAPSAPAGPSNTVSLDRDTYDLLVAQAKQGAQAAADKARAERAAEVDAWIKDGRIPASQRDKVLNIMHENPGLAREVYGANLKDTVPMGELGHVGGGMPKNKADEMLAKAESLRANNKKKGK